jgi:hypothetical protein
MKMKQKFIKVVPLLKYNIMKLYVLILLFTSIIFSQHEKETLTLFDSIMAIEPYEQPNYSKNLHPHENMQRDEFTRLNDDYTKLKNICFDRIYIKVFDQLELGIILIH